VKDISFALNGLLLKASRKAQAYILLLTLLFLGLVVFSSQLVIFSSFEKRALVNELHVLQQQRDAMQVEWGQLLLEQSAWGSYNRVEELVNSQLDMQVPLAKNVVMARQP